MKSLLLSILTLVFLTSCMNSKETNNNEDDIKVSDGSSKISPEEALKQFDQAHLMENKELKTSKEKKKTMSESNTLNIQLDDGTVKVKLRPDLAPKHVERIKTLTEQGFYNGLKFHRVIDGFMAQTGDPGGDGTGGSDLPDLQAEFSQAEFKRGVLGMARAQSPDSANSQFFIMLADSSHLNGQYTVFGEVTEGMEFVDKVKKGPSHLNGAVDDPDVMKKVTLGE